MRRMTMALVLILAVSGCRGGGIGAVPRKLPVKPVSPPPSAKPVSPVIQRKTPHSLSSPALAQGRVNPLAQPTPKPSHWQEISREVCQQLAEHYFRRQSQPFQYPNQPVKSRSVLDPETDRLLRLIELEMARAVREQRAFGGNNGTVRVLGIQLQNRIYVEEKGQSYLVAQIQSSNNPALLAGDVIFAADGMLLAPGQDLTVILNRPGATEPALLLVLRLGEFTVVPAFTTIVRYQPQEINQRRVLDAAEKVYLDLQVSQGIIRNPAW